MLTWLRTYAVTGLINRALRRQTAGDLQAHRHLDRLFARPFDDDDRTCAALSLISVVCRDLPRPTATGNAELRFTSVDPVTGEASVEEPDQVPATLLCWGRMVTAYLRDDIDTVIDLWDGYVTHDQDRARQLLRLALEAAGAATVGHCTCEHDGDHR